MTSSIPQPIRTFSDPVTGVTMHQITQGDEPAAHLYFTRPSWTPDGKYLIFLQERQGSLNFYITAPTGEVRQLTRFPATLHPSPFFRHMHRIFRTSEVERLTFRSPAVHPFEPYMVFAWGNTIHMFNLDTGSSEPLYTFPPSESHAPETGLHISFTCDGKDLIFTTNRHARPGERLDPPDQRWNFDLRDESGNISKIWRFDFEKRQMLGGLFESNGEQSHLLTCPWDAERVLWVNYLHKCIYTMRRDGSNLRRFLNDDDDVQCGHYNWDIANRRVTLVMGGMGDGNPANLISMDIDSGDVKKYSNALQRGGQYHQSVSPDGRWVVFDAPGIPIGNSNGLHVLEQETDTCYPLCELNCSWGKGLTDNEGNAVKSEYLHPNPSWSPDGRYVIVSTDFGGGPDAAEVYIVDFSTWKPNV